MVRPDFQAYARMFHPLNDEPDAPRSADVAEFCGQQIVRCHQRPSRSVGPRRRRRAVQLDATIRFKLAGMKFLVVAQAKAHNHPITRDVVQLLHQKLQSVGAHKGVVISTAPFQSVHSTSPGPAALPWASRLSWPSTSKEPNLGRRGWARSLTRMLSGSPAPSFGVDASTTRSLGRDLL